jgi:hypothetical protein
MIEEYIFKTMISFISINAVMFITRDNWRKINPKKNGFIKRNFFKLAMCSIPIIRWFWVFMVLLCGIVLSDDEFVNEYNEKINKKEEEKKGK